MNEKLLLGEPTIDRQHRELFTSFRRLLSNRTNGEAVSDELSGLTLQIHVHFKTEEEWMSNLNIPAGMLHAHEQAHTQIIEELTEIHLGAMHGLEVPFEDIVSRVATYVSKHVVEFDLPLKPYIQTSHTS